MEIYVAYKDYLWMMEFTEQMLELAVIFLEMVDLIGIEPTTLRMRTVRSPS